MKEAEETPEMEAKEHSPSFLRKAVRAKKRGGKRRMRKGGRK